MRPATEVSGLELDRVSKSFDGDAGEPVHAVVDVSLRVQRGELVILIGHNGSGKSTLLNLIAGDFPPDEGAIRLVRSNGEATEWSRTARWKRAELVTRIYQEPGRGTVHELTVEENFRLAGFRSALPSPFRISPSAEQRQRFIERLRRVDMETKLHARVETLSQGQRQLLALDLALEREPAILLLDEHTASLDRSNAARCMEVTEALSREARVAALLVTHNLRDALRYGDRLVVMHDGRIVADLDRDEKQAVALSELVQLAGM